ncbi:MAG: helix-turn-helix domain-containing protein [Polyangiales bacterium]
MATPSRAPAPQFTPGERFLTVGVVAEHFGVTEVTIKNWVDAGQLLAARTVGGHRRIAASSVVRLLEEQGRPVPTQLARRKPVVVILESETGLSKSLRRAVGTRARVEAAEDLYAGLLLVARVRPDVVVVDLAAANGDAKDLLSALRTDPQTKPIDVLAAGSSTADAKTVAALSPAGTPPRGTGSITFVRRTDVPSIAEAINVRVDRPPTLARARRR